MKIINIGSLNLDYVYRVENIVTPGETVAALSREEFCGGKGLNQSVALARSGGQVFHGGMTGTDHGKLLELLKQSGVNIDYISLHGSQTGHAVIQVEDGGQNSIIVYGGANKEIKPEYIKNILKNFSPGDLLVLQNEISCVREAMEIGGKSGLKIAFNPSPFTEEILDYPLEYVDWLILNSTEGFLMSGEKDPEKIVTAINKKYPDMKIVLTLGKKGALCFDGKESHVVEGFKVDAVDTTDAGDTFTGYFLSSLILFAAEKSGAGRKNEPFFSFGDDKEDIIRALEYANGAAALAVTVKGAAGSIPDRQKVEEFLAKRKKL